MKSTPLPLTHEQELIKSDNQFPVVGIGASAGGLEAFKKLLQAIPEDSGMAYVLVQHLDPSHESVLPELLQKVTKVPVLEISNDLKVEPNHIYVIPSNKMMVANDGVLQLTDRPHKSKNIRNLPIDLFFSSLAEVHQSHAIGVVLSGTASDGTAGLKAIKAYGGITFAQDEESAAYEGMPKSAAQAGVVDFILRPEEIPQKILEVNRSMNINSGKMENLPKQQEEAFKQIITLVRMRKGVDFTYYKQTTIRRRILRRMALNRNEDTAGYLKFLRENKGEQDTLYQDFLIPFTAFFRDTKVFNNLCEKVFPSVVNSKLSDETIRIWVAGCSTGEEAYSIAMCLKEYLGDREGKVQIFASDISEPAIAKARTGIYTKSEVETVSSIRLQEFFTKNDGKYQINKNIRDMCVFAVHNFLKDPPFGKIDIVICRNVLIYLDSYLQKKALTTFHYSLNPKGFLLLGKTETASSVLDLFSSVDKNDKLFLRKDVIGRFVHVMSPSGEHGFNQFYMNQKNKGVTNDFQSVAEEIILTKYMPTGVIVNEAMDIVHFRGSTGKYLEQLSGKPSHNLLKMAKHGLGFELRNIIYKAKKDRKTFSKNNIPLTIHGSMRYISIEAIPLPKTIEPYYLILFHESSLTNYFSASISANTSTTGKTKQDDRDIRIQQLEQELAQTREDMRSITENQEAANEELQSANEELLSGSEELQSLNEELETSKEELHSTNEELLVVNQELSNSIEQVTEARNYAEAIVATVHESLVVLDRNLRVKTANAAYYHNFQVNEADTIGRLIFEINDEKWNIPELRELLEKILTEKSSFKDYEITHTLSNADKRILLLNASEVLKESDSEKLILLAIEDITELKKAEAEQREIQKRFQFIADSIPQKVWTADAAGNFNYFNKIWLNYTLLTFEELKDWGWKRVIHPGDFEEYRKLWQHSISSGEDFEFEHRVLNKDGEYRWHLSRGLAYKDDNGQVLMWVGTNTEIEVQKKQKKELEEAVTRRTFELQLANESLQQKNQEIALSKYNKRFLSEFSEKFSSYSSNLEFFNSLVKFISDLTHLDYVLVAQLESTGEDKYDVQTLALTAFDKLVDNIKYPLLDGPCEEVIRGTVYSYPENCRITFPKNQTLVQFNVEGYIGYPLCNADGVPIGLLAVMHEKGIEDPETVASILKIVAKRAEIEMERVKFEEQLKQNNKILKEKNEELVNMNKELQSFAYVASHDLQEPLRKIQAFAVRLLDKENENLSDKGKDYFKRMQSAALRMQKLIEDLLAFSRIKTSERKFEQIELNKIVQEVKTDLRDQIKEKEANIEVMELCSVNVIVFQFNQLMCNLISNALKFSKPEIKPHVLIKSVIKKGDELMSENAALTSDVLQPDRNYCHISVTDNGIGFEPQYSERIFGVFQKLHGKEEYVGTGIGLAIVKKIVENHNGIITARSELGEGATFDIYLPGV